MVEAELLWFTPDPERLIGAAMARCYRTAIWDDLYPKITEEYASYLVKSAFYRLEFDVYEHVRALFQVGASDREMLELVRDHPYLHFSPMSSNNFVASLNLRTLLEMARQCRGENCRTFTSELDKISPTIRECLLDPPKKEPVFPGEKPIKGELRSNSEMRVILVRGLTSKEILSLLSSDLSSNELLKQSYFTFEIEGVSRAFSHQFVRHRPCSFSQESQRFSDAPKESFVIPKSVVDAQVQAKVQEYVDQGRELYKWLRSKGVPKEDARFALHTGLATKILVTIPTDQLLHMAFYRSDYSDIGAKAQWEIRKVVSECYSQARAIEPLLPAKPTEF